MITQQTSSRAVNAAIKAVKTSADKYNKLVQEAIVLIIGHSKDFSDCTGAERLLNAMPRSNRRSLAIAHFEQYSPINVRKDGDAFKASLRKPDDKRYNNYDLDGVKVNNWFERPEAEKLADVIDLAMVVSDFDRWCEAEKRKAYKVKAEAEGMEDGPAKTNRMDDATNIVNFVDRLRKAAKAPASAVPAAAAA